MGNREHSAAPFALVAAAAMFAAVGCGGEPGGPRVVVRIQGTDAAGPEHNVAVTHFAERLSQLSHGRLRVKMSIARVPRDPHQTGSHDPEDERNLIRRVARGQTDIAWVGTHVFSTVGVQSFDALDAPMLVDSYTLQSAVLRSEIPQQMLAPAKAVGVTGLGVLGGRLSRPVAVKRPLIRAEQFRGLRWRVLRSVPRDAAVRALGGRPNHVVSPGFMLPIWLLTGHVGAVETNLDSLFFQLVPQTPTAYVTENVRLWPDASALIANPRWLARLSARQRTWVREAARDAQSYSAAAIDSDAGTVPDLCATGVRFAEAQPAVVVALRRAFTPAYADLRRDRVTRGYIARIRALKATLPADPPLRVPAACAADHPTPAGKGPAVRSTIPDGVYRTRLTARDLHAASVSGPDIQRFTGTETLRLGGGRWTLDLQGSFGHSRQAGTYSGSAARTVWRQLELDGKPARRPFESRVSLRYANGRLVFGGLGNDLFRALYSAHPWERIG
ncbi:MAG TPA: hypothetical protein VF066_16255 [Thermoleophilaceae bacterium]